MYPSKHLLRDSLEIEYNRLVVLRAAGLADSPIGRVYHMPGASDAYVVTFRSWLLKVAGGGPFGPQNEQWLQVNLVSYLSDVFRQYGRIYSRMHAQKRYGFTCRFSQLYS